MYQINESIKISFDGQKEWSILNSKREICPRENDNLYHWLIIEAYSNREIYELEEKLRKNENIQKAKIKVYYGQVLVYEILFKNLKILKISEEINEGSMPVTTISFVFESNETNIHKDLGNIVKSEF